MVSLSRCFRVFVPIALVAGLVAAPASAVQPAPGDDGVVVGSAPLRGPAWSERSGPRAAIPARVRLTGCRLTVVVDWNDRLDSRAGRDVFNVRVLVKQGSRSREVAGFHGRGNQPDKRTYSQSLSRRDCARMRNSSARIVAVTQKHDGPDRDRLFERNAATVLTSAPATGTRVCSQRMIIFTTNSADCDFPGVDLRGAELPGANFSRANLAGADLTGATLLDATFAGADLTAANLTGTNLVGADFGYANLTRANFTQAYAMYANFWGATAPGATWTGCHVDAAGTRC